MRPQGHIVVSVGLGTLFWARSRDIWTLVISLLFGVLVDLDHLFDYFYAERRLTFDLHEFLGTRYWKKSGRLFVLFHGFEYLPLVYFVWQGLKGHRWAVAATSAMSVHLLADHLLNELRPLGYFVLYRLAHGFRAADILDLPKSRRLEAARARREAQGRDGRLPLRGRVINFFV
ncbi:MAG: hypothetical protein ACRDHX_15675 [Chloroflexota bacterium]